MPEDKPWHSPKSPSQCQQDLCVLEIIKKPGVFLDIGSSKPIKDNNTYLLEQNGWTGICIDKNYYNYSKIVDNLKDTGLTSKDVKPRICNFLHGDAIELLYTLENTEYDYISLDIDGDTNKALRVILKNNISFKFMTIEHDLFKLPKTVQDEQRELLYDSGYEPLFLNIQPYWNFHVMFEDWWYDPKANFPIIKELESLNVLGSSYRPSNNILWLLQQAGKKA